MPEISFSGPHDADVVTAARGLPECNALLLKGWRIIWSSLSPLQQISPRRTAWVPLFILGRRFAEGESEEVTAITIEQANEGGEDALEGPPIVETAEAEAPDAPPIPESVPPPVPARVGTPRRTRNASGSETELTGIR